MKITTNLAAGSTSLWCQGWEMSRWAQRFLSSSTQNPKVRELVRPSTYMEDLWAFVCFPFFKTVAEFSSLPSGAWDVRISFLVTSRHSSAPVGHLRSSSWGRLHLTAKACASLPLTSLESHIPLSARENLFLLAIHVIRSGLSGNYFYLFKGQLSHFTMSSQEQ